MIWSFLKRFRKPAKTALWLIEELFWFTLWLFTQYLYYKLTLF